jgi:hypothetical protein
MEQMGLIVGKVVETKLNVVGYSADEEKIVQKLCQFVQESKYFDRVFFFFFYSNKIVVQRFSFLMANRY